jgi:Mg-chelatase subunit ChlI
MPVRLQSRYPEGDVRHLPGAVPPDLPKISAAMRVVELPISATEDKVVGSLDIEHALKKERRSSSPGFSLRPTGTSSMSMK